jgi:hypothetical protein
MHKFLGGLLLLVGAAGVYAQDSNWRVMGGIAMANGGGVITTGTISVIGTSHVIPFEVKAGMDTQYRLGLEYRLFSHLALQGSVGYSITEPMGINGSLEFTTIPVELLAYANITQSLRVGAGVRKARADLTGSGVASNSPELGSYASTVGKVLEVQYLFSASESSKTFAKTQAGFSARVVNEEFTHGGITTSGNHYELGLVVYF